jgi:hypothetical protein
MAIGPLRTWYAVLDFMLITMTVSMILYVFVVDQKHQKFAFFLISIASPRHLLATLIGEFL